MNPPFGLRAFGAIHFDDLDKVSRELAAFSEDVDAIFVEYPAEALGVRDLLALLVRVPAYAVGVGALQLLLYSPLFVLFNRDLLPTEYVAARSLAADRGLELHHVDEHPTELQFEAGWRTILANWLLVAPAIALAPLRAPVAMVVLLGAGFLPLLVRRRGYRRSAMALVPVGVAALFGAVAVTWTALWLFFVGALLAVRTLQGSIDHRNDAMLDRVETLAAAEGYEDAVLVTGKAHLGGIVTGALDRGFDVPAAHVSRFRKPGTTHDPVDEDALGDLPDADDPRTTPEPVPGSERTAFLRRVGAAIVDLAFGGVFWFLCVFLLVGVREEGAIRATDETLFAGFLAAWVVTFLGFGAVQEWRRGATVGKHLLGLVVVDETGELPSRRAAVLRNLPRPLGAAVGYVVGGVTALASENNRTLGDRLAGTYVCRRAPAHDD